MLSLSLFPPLCSAVPQKGKAHWPMDSPHCCVNRWLSRASFRHTLHLYSAKILAKNIALQSTKKPRLLDISDGYSKLECCVDFSRRKCMVIVCRRSQVFDGNLNSDRQFRGKGEGWAGTFPHHCALAAFREARDSELLLARLLKTS